MHGVQFVIVPSLARVEEGPEVEGEEEGERRPDGGAEKGHGHLARHEKNLREEKIGIQRNCGQPNVRFVCRVTVIIISGVGTVLNQIGGAKF